jgi:glycosyltransferase involved in cell wall biosynthesis
MSPFEATTPIDVMWPLWARDSRIVTVVTLYDLIPLVFPDQYLHHRGMRAYYYGRLQLIRHVDGILALSKHTAEDAVERLQVSPERIHVINAGTSERFSAMYPSPVAAWEHLSRELRTVRPGFLLYVGGADFRKNMEGMIAGFARLAQALRARHQLVIANILHPGQAELLRADAERAGIEPEQLVLTGHVSDSDLGALYHACTLFVFPSFYEGFGLPILEAMSCGAPVAASTATSVPEVLGDLDGTFNPHDPDSIASCLTDVLTSAELLDRLKARSERRVAEFTWERVAEESIQAYERTVAGTRRRRFRRARVAFVTPWPPEQTRIADYNRRLAAELGQHVDLDVIVGDPVDVYPESQERGVRLIDAGDMEGMRALRQPDRILYCMGSSGLHRHVYELLRRRPGAVVLHDVSLTGFYRWYAGVERPEAPESAFADRIRAMYGSRLPPYATQDGKLASGRRVALGVYMTRELQSYAEQCLVHSRFAGEVLEFDRPTSDRRVPVSVVPFGIPPVTEARRRDGAHDALIVSFGDVTDVRGMTTLIDAFELLFSELPTARLVITGHVAPDARTQASRAPVEFLGNVGPERYLELLETADLAVQLRLPSDEQAPVLVADCLAHGLPTVVSDLGWAGELPPDVTHKVPSGVSPNGLKDSMLTLLRDRRRLASLSAGAIEYARTCSFARVADAYLDALGLT